jgi:hypothetical protein
MGRLLNEHPIGAVAVVEAPVSISYARKARITFLTVAVSVAAVTAMVLAVFAHPVLAVLIGIVAGLVCGFVAAVLVRVWPVLRVLWWWSPEITIGALVVLGPAVLARLTWPWLALLLVLAVAVTCGVVGPVRRALAAWSWCLVVRHRLRLCFAQFLRSAARTHPGSLPLVLWARPTPAGERVWLWLRPGLDLVYLDGKTGRIAVACWASEARVVRASTRYAALMRVDLARRDPLTDRVASPLALLIPRRTNGTNDGGNDNAAVPVSPGLPPVGLDLADVPESVPEPRGGRR